MQKKITRKEWERQQFEADFYERWGSYLPVASNAELERLREKLEDITASHPETMQYLKTMVLTQLAIREQENEQHKHS